MSITILRKANEEETEYIQMVYDNLNEKCAFEYASSLGITDWQYCYYCAGETPTNFKEECTICLIKRDNHEDNDQ